MKKLLVLTLLFCFTKTKAQIITTIAGDSIQGFNGDGGQAFQASLHLPEGLTVDYFGNLFIADTYNNRIRKVNTSGVITTIAGSGAAGVGTGGFSGDGGQATTASLNTPTGIVVDLAGNLYVADAGNNRIRKIDANTGVISTIAGTGTAGYSLDSGAATLATLNSPNSLVLDKNGNLYFTDQENDRIRKINLSTGLINTVAGGNAVGAYGGDGGLATNALLNTPTGITIDSTGNLYFSDYGNNRIRKVNLNTNIITTIAGDSTRGYNGDGILASIAKLDNPFNMAADALGNIYIADSYGQRIRKIDVNNGIISTIVGYGFGAGCFGGGFSGDGGNATVAKIGTPGGLTFDVQGNLLFTDIWNNRIRKVTNIANGIEQFTVNIEEPIIYPNPANNKIIIDANDVVDVKLFDVLGKQILHAKQNDVDVSNVNDGVYFIQVQTTQNTTTQKIMVQH